MLDDDDRARDYIRRQAEADAQAFLEEGIDPDTTGVPPPPRIKVDEIATRRVELDLFAGGGQGAATQPAPFVPPPSGACVSPSYIQVDFDIVVGELGVTCVFSDCHFSHTFYEGIDYTACPFTILYFNETDVDGCSICDTSIAARFWEAIGTAIGTSGGNFEAELDIHCTEGAPCGGTMSCGVNIPAAITPGVYSNVCSSGPSGATPAFTAVITVTIVA